MHSCCDLGRSDRTLQQGAASRLALACQVPPTVQVNVIMRPAAYRTAYSNVISTSAPAQPCKATAHAPLSPHSLEAIVHAHYRFACMFAAACCCLQDASMEGRPSGAQDAVQCMRCVICLIWIVINLQCSVESAAAAASSQRQDTCSSYTRRMHAVTPLQQLQRIHAVFTA
jgi:hypothetical protein